MLKYLSMIILGIILISGTGYGKLSKDDTEKREKVRYAIDNGIISIYDIPFDTYINLEMWDEIRFILEANNKNVIQYDLPGMYYSRPFIINDTVWVFETTGKGIFVFKPNSLELINTLNDDRYAKYNGGVKKVLRNTIISGGFDEDVDAAAIWNIDTDEFKTVKLQDGHYISSIEADDDQLYIGSCGGLINVWKYDEDASYTPSYTPLDAVSDAASDASLESAGIYTSSKKENINWNVFNQKECITGIKVSEDSIVGVGEKTIFIWDIENEIPIKTYAKHQNGSFVFFYENYLVEYKNDKIAIRNLENGKIVSTIITEKPVEDLIVTSEKILADYDGDLLILSLHHNKGIVLYNFKTSEMIEKLNVKGQTLAVYKNAIFATDDTHVYRYYVINRNPAEYNTFLKKIDPDKITLNKDTYPQIFTQLQDYPEIIKQSGISEKFLNLNHLTIEHMFKYGKIGERFVPYDESVSSSSSDNSGERGYKEDVFGYKAVYEIKNHADTYYLVTIASVWSGEYGKESDTLRQKNSFYRQSFFVPPNGGFRDQFEVGEKEPANLFIYPEKIEIISEAYYKNFTKAVSRENTNTRLIDKYLKDDLVQNWHSKLEKRKKEIIKEKKNKSWFFRLFR